MKCLIFSPFIVLFAFVHASKIQDNSDTSQTNLNKSRRTYRLEWDEDTFGVFVSGTRPVLQDDRLAPFQLADPKIEGSIFEHRRPLSNSPAIPIKASTPDYTPVQPISRRRTHQTGTRPTPSNPIPITIPIPPKTVGRSKGEMCHGTYVHIPLSTLHLHENPYKGWDINNAMHEFHFNLTH